MALPYEITPPESPHARLSYLCRVRTSNDGGYELIPDEDFEDISALLEEIGRPEWARRPRIYTILRMMELHGEMDAFISLGHNDNSLPYRNKRSLPPKLQSLDISRDFLNLQSLVLNAACDLEKGAQGKHISIADGDRLFKRGKVLGSGGTGTVDEVESKLSGKVYARKRIKRKGGRVGKELFARFESELSALKKLHHEHLVEVHASYTDLKYVAILMRPVAERNLKEYMRRGGPEEKDKPLFRTYYGCLASAVAYLKVNQIRHNDIKPENILLKHDQIFITDFGTALDWSGTEYSNSITRGDPKSITARYQSPEVAAGAPRGSSSDVWSLGVVFLEMTTVLRGHSLESMDGFFAKHGTENQYVFHNLAAAISWFKVLQPISPRSDNEPLQWIKDMISRKPAGRPAIADLCQEIREAASGMFCGQCCRLGDSESESSAGFSESDLDDNDMELTITPTRTDANPEPLVSSHSDSKAPQDRVREHVRQPQQFASSVFNAIQKFWRMPVSLSIRLGSRTSSDGVMPPPRVVTPWTDGHKYVNSLPGAFEEEEERSEEEEGGAEVVDKHISGYRPASEFSDETNKGEGDTEEAAESLSTNTFLSTATLEPNFYNPNLLLPVITTKSQLSNEGDHLKSRNPSIKRREVKLLHTRSYEDLRRQTESLLKNVDRLQRRNSHGCLCDGSDALEDVNFEDIKNELKSFRLNSQYAAVLNAMDRRFIIITPKVVPDPTGIIPDVPRKPEKRGARNENFSFPKSNNLKSWLDGARNPLPLPSVSLPLTDANLEKLINKPQRREEKEGGGGIINASVYMKKIHDDAASSVPTSVLSTRTANHLKRAGLLLPFQDSSFSYLEHYSKLGKAAAVRMLLESGCNPGTRRHPRRGPVFNAVRGASERHSKCLRELIKYGVNLNAKDLDKRRTPLHYAIEHESWSGYSDLIYTLLAGGADPNIKDGTGDVPLLQILYGGNEPLEEHRRNALALLLAPNFRTNVIVSPPGTMNTPLHLAVRRKDPWAVGMILEKSVLVNEKNGSGLTPLQIAVTSWSDAVSHDQMEILRLLLKKEANVNVQNVTDKSTPLHAAVLFEMTAAVRILLKHGARTTIKNSLGLSPIDLFVQQKALHKPCTKCAEIEKLLI